MKTIIEKTEGNKANEIMSKLITKQIVMKNKFKKAYENRLEREYNLNQSMEPLITSLSSTNKTEATKESHSLRNLPKNTAQQLRLATKSYSGHIIKSRPMSTTTIKLNHNKNDSENDFIVDDPDKLCLRLRLLLTAGHMNHVEEINTIIRKLRELDILEYKY